MVKMAHRTTGSMLVGVEVGKMMKKSEEFFYENIIGKHDHFRHITTSTWTDSTLFGNYRSLQT
jgi:hypothetical protein